MHRNLESGRACLPGLAEAESINCTQYGFHSWVVSPAVTISRLPAWATSRTPHVFLSLRVFITVILVSKEKKKERKKEKKGFWVSRKGKYQINMSHLISLKWVYWYHWQQLQETLPLLPNLMKFLLSIQIHRFSYWKLTKKRKKCEEGSARESETILLSWNDF